MVISLAESNLFRLPMERHRRLQRELDGFAQSETATASGAGVAAAAGALDGTGRAIFIGVSTGVLVWTVTRLLDRAFGLSK